MGTFQRDVNIWNEAERLDVERIIGARLLRRLTGTAKRFGDNIDLAKLRRSELVTPPLGPEEKGTRLAMEKDIRNFLEHLEESTGLENSKRAGEAQIFFYNKLS